MLKRALALTLSLLLLCAAALGEMSQEAEEILLKKRKSSRPKQPGAGRELWVRAARAGCFYSSGTTSIAPWLRTVRTWQLPAPKTPSMAAR